MEQTILFFISKKKRMTFYSLKKKSGLNKYVHLYDGCCYCSCFFFFLCSFYLLFYIFFLLLFPLLFILHRPLFLFLSSFKLLSFSSHSLEGARETSILIFLSLDLSSRKPISIYFFSPYVPRDQLASSSLVFD